MGLGARRHVAGRAHARFVRQLPERRVRPLLLAAWHHRRVGAGHDIRFAHASAAGHATARLARDARAGGGDHAGQLGHGGKLHVPARPASPSFAVRLLRPLALVAAVARRRGHRADPGVLRALLAARPVALPCGGRASLPASRGSAGASPSRGGAYATSSVRWLSSRRSSGRRGRRSRAGRPRGHTRSAHRMPGWAGTTRGRRSRCRRGVRRRA